MRDLWTIPKIWPNSTIFIIGGGPSLLQQDLTLIHNRRVIGVNQAYKLGSWVDICWFGDKSWYKDRAGKEIKYYKGLIVTCSTPEDRIHKNRINYVGRSRERIDGIESKSRNHVRWNHNSGASAINLAYWLGASTIVLLGFDMQIPNDRKDYQDHWHNDYGVKISKTTGKLYDPYRRFMECWPRIAKDAKRLRLRIINTTPAGALNLFERMTLEEVCETL